MMRAVVLLTATLLFASLGAVAQNSSSPSGGQAASAQNTAPNQNAHPPAPTANVQDNSAQNATKSGANKGIQDSAQGQDPRTASSAELPQTSTILPLLGLLGLGSLVAGLFARR